MSQNAIYMIQQNKRQDERYNIQDTKQRQEMK